MADEGKEMFVFVGTYTRGKNDGIYLFRMDMKSGKITSVTSAQGVKNPSFLALHPTGHYLYSVSEIGNFQGKRVGGVSSFSICPETRELMALNQEPSGGSGPCHVSVDATGKYVLVANYGDGSVAMLPIREDGQVGEPSSVIQHSGHGADPRRQKGPHAHSITPSPDNRYAYAADLGLDKLLIYQLDLEKGKLVPNNPPFARVAPAAGPRHFAFHPNARFAYVINEMNNTITAFHYDPGTGALAEFQTIGTLPKDFKERSWTADVHLHPSGKFLYGTNRGHNSIAIFAVDAKSGRLELIGREPTRGDFPRNFGIDPTGTFLLVANQKTNNIFGFHIDPQTGKLAYNGQETEVPIPVCIKYLQV